VFVCGAETRARQTAYQADARSWGDEAQIGSLLLSSVRWQLHPNAAVPEEARTGMTARLLRGQTPTGLLVEADGARCRVRRGEASGQYLELAVQGGGERTGDIVENCG
jgi:hypothetical protein